MEDNKKKIDSIIGDYQYGFHVEVDSILDTGKGINEKIVKAISDAKNEPEWMRAYRLESYQHFMNIPNPNFGPDLSFINFDEFTYFLRTTDKALNNWNDVPKEIKKHI